MKRPCLFLAPQTYLVAFWALGGHSAPLINSSLSLNPVNLSVCGRMALGPGTVSGRQEAFHMGQSLPATQEDVPVMTDEEEKERGS